MIEPKDPFSALRDRGEDAGTAILRETWDALKSLRPSSTPCDCGHQLVFTTKRPEKARKYRGYDKTAVTISFQKIVADLCSSSGFSGRFRPFVFPAIDGRQNTASWEV